MRQRTRGNGYYGRRKISQLNRNWNDDDDDDRDDDDDNDDNDDYDETLNYNYHLL